MVSWPEEARRRGPRHTGGRTHSKTSLRWTVLLPPRPQGIVIFLGKCLLVCIRFVCVRYNGDVGDVERSGSLRAEVDKTRRVTSLKDGDNNVLARLVWG